MVTMVHANPSDVSMMLVVAVALLNERGQVLLAKRPQGKGHAGCWEFPGGKVCCCGRIDSVSASAWMHMTWDEQYQILHADQCSGAARTRA